MNGFKEHFTNGIRWNRDTNLKSEISAISKDGFINRIDNWIIKEILKYNIKRKREKLLLINTGKKELLKLMGIRGLSLITKRKIKNILSNKNISKEKIKNNEIKNNKLKYLLNLISEAEGTKNYGYNIRYGHKKTPNLSNLTINQVINYQRRLKGHTAIGKYQIKKSTLIMLKKYFGGTRKMTPNIQDKMALKLLEIRGLNKFIEGRISLTNFQNKIAHEWASLPMSNGKSAYNGDRAGNHSRITSYKLRKTLLKLRT